ncbi:MAG: glycosyltransferase family 2 protein [Anaerolineae bacterium]|nr:glycosyltransferase family 2 protein [Anaerolineae bacterium]
MPENKVSIALCTCNGTPYIQAQLESILNQTRPPDEIVICDDASTDNTVDIIKATIGKQSCAVTLIRNEKKLGVRKNFSQAIERATGDIIFLSDQDDIWLPDRVAIMLRPFLADSSVGLVYSNAAIVDIHLQPTGRSFLDFVSLSKIDSPKSSDVVRFNGGIPGCLLAIKATLKPFVLPISSKWFYDYYIAFIAHALNKVIKIDQSLMYYRRHDKNVSSNDVFEGNLLLEFSAAKNASLLDFYSSDRLQWEYMLQHLREVANMQTLHKSTQLVDYLIECEHRVKFARERETFRKKSFLFRFGPALKCLLSGKYHRYLRGIKTFGKDWLL